MKKILFFFFLQMIAKTTLFGQLAEDVEYCVQGKTNAYHKLNLDKLANLRYPGDANFDVKYYKLNLELTYSPNYLKG
ncbi:MAG: peptidase M1, partial [Bacteroidota bacterium]